MGINVGILIIVKRGTFPLIFKLQHFVTIIILETTFAPSYKHYSGNLILATDTSKSA